VQVAVLVLRIVPLPSTRVQAGAEGECVILAIIVCINVIK
jgi:hypothetical protein